MLTSQLSLLLALGSAASAGSADYFAGRAARDIPAIRVTAWVQGAGLVLIPFAGAFTGWPGVGGGALALAAIGGLAIAVGLSSLYRALALGPMGVTGPVAAVIGASVPIVTDLGVGATLASLQYGGLLLGLVAVTLLAWSPGPRAATAASRAGIAYAVLAGLGIGCFTVLLDASSPGTGLWPLLVSRAVAAGLLGLLALRYTQPAHSPPLPWQRLVIAGLLDSGANVAFLAALRLGELALVAVIVAFYPGFTVALATTIDGERMQRVQIAGIVAAAAAIALISWPG